MQSEPRENHTTRQGMERSNDVSRRNVNQVNVPVPSTSTTQMIIKQNPIDTTSQGCRGTIMKYIKDIKVNDHIMTRAFIDPGSAVCTVRQKFIDEHNINCYRANETLYGFGTDNKVNSNEFAKVIVTMDNIKEDVLMYVVPDDVQFTDILLGRSLTDKTNLAYVQIDDNLHFGYRDELPFRDIQLRDETRRIKLYADEDVILKGDMINLIMVTGEYNDLWPVMNSTTEDFEVTKGQCVFNVTERKIEIQEENLCVGSDVTMSMLNIDKSIPLDEESKAKTAFVTEDQTGEFERLVFGLKNAPAQFSHLMALVLAPLKQKGILVYYLDDVLIGTNSWTEMLNKLEQTLQAFRNAKLTLKLEKCEFGREHVEFLGYSVNRGGISPGQRKTEAVRQYKRPETVYEVRRFLGLTSYFRRFVPNYAVIAKPLSDLTKKNGNFEWSKDQENAFDQLKGKLTSKPILKLYNPEHYTQLHTVVRKSPLFKLKI
nr:unnamed protein product [Callosobruchus analis]